MRLLVGSLLQPLEDAVLCGLHVDHTDWERLSRIEGAFVQRDPLTIRMTVHHPTHTAIPDRQRFLPLLCKSIIPELHIPPKSKEADE